MCWGDKTPTPSASGASSCPPGASAPCPLDCATKVEFKEHSPTTYGFDDHTDASGPWKSVEVGKTDKVQAEITPAGKFANVAFTSSDTAKVTESPTTATSNSQEITLTGVTKGESEIKGACGGAELGKMKVKAYTKNTKTVAVRLVNETGWTSTDVADADIKAALQKVYAQAVVEFTLTRLPAKTVAFDINGDGKIDVDSWMSAEMAKVRDACKDDSYDFNIFLVDNPSDGSTGFMQLNQRYGFIHAGNSKNPSQTIAHEMGHGQGLSHESSDSVNVMHPTAEANVGEFKKWRLRKDQWDKVNP